MRDVPVGDGSVGRAIKIAAAIAASSNRPHRPEIAPAGVTLRFGPLRGSLPRRERLALHCLKLSGFETYVPRARRPKPVVESRSEEKVEAGLVEAGEQRKADHLAASTGANRCSQNKQGSHDRCRLLDTRG